jgi:hypothetical protein
MRTSEHSTKKKPDKRKKERPLKLKERQLPRKLKLKLLLTPLLRKLLQERDKKRKPEKQSKKPIKKSHHLKERSKKLRMTRERQRLKLTIRDLKQISESTKLCWKKLIIELKPPRLSSLLSPKPRKNSIKNKQDLQLRSKNKRTESLTKTSPHPKNYLSQDKKIWNSRLNT